MPRYYPPLDSDDDEIGAVTLKIQLYVSLLVTQALLCF